MARYLRFHILLLAIAAASACHRSAPGAASPAGGPARGGSLTASLRSEPPTFNRFAPTAAQAPVDAVARLTQATLVRVNRLTGDPEPWLAERWTTSADGRTLTFTLRDGVAFSDGVPFTSEDVLFSFRALYDPSVGSVLASGVMVQGKPLQIAAPDARTVVVTLPAPFAPGAALLDNVPIYPKHLLQAALDAHTFAAAWGVTTPPATMAGLGPFVVSEYVPGQRLTLARNPHYWRRDAAGVALPYLDRIVVEFVKGQDAEMLRLEAGSIDLMTQADVAPENISSLRRLRDRGALQIAEPGVSVDPILLWFNLTAAAAAKNAQARPYLQRTEFRQAISYAIDRDAIVNTLYLGAAVPVYGPVTPGNRTWYADSAPKYPHDPARAAALLAGLGLTDRNGDGALEDAAGRPVRFSILTQGNHIRGRTAAMVQEQLRTAGIAVDLVELDPPSLFGRFGSGDYDAICYGLQTSAFDPALNLDFWLSSGSNHVWNPEQKTPATPWERAIDDLMQKQAAAPALAERQRLFAEVQRLFGENLPGIYLVSPKVTIAMSRRVGGAVPVLLDPKILWQADSLYAK
ncbi:MAG TPA: ABC transporter substrate-binding protein [Vicinamibacterales bacterium]|nr:ABC transporter substrate-binding protein [Vicinamibacterales bacterium]